MEVGSHNHGEAIAGRGGEKEDEIEDQSPVEEVALTVTTKDDPSLPVWTFRMWSIGIISCILLSFLNQFFSYRSQPIVISMIVIQVAALPIGHFMAKVLPKRKLKLPLSHISVCLNPGPFNMKEHVLITIFANAGTAFGNGPAYAVLIVDIIKALYKRNIPFITGLLLILTTQVLGYGWAGLFRKYLIEPPHMWWPGTLVQVSLFRALHEKEKRRGISRFQFFLVFVVASFAYYTFPNYFASVLTYFSWVCWIFPNSVMAHQIGSGLHGLGLGSFSLDWTGVSAFLGSPLVAPFFAIVNIAVGFVVIVYLVIPVAYWNNIYNAKLFPLYSYKHLYRSDGSIYDINAILDDQFNLNETAYQIQGQVNLSLMFSLTYGFGFATIAATLTHVLCFYGKEIWQRAKASLNSKPDVHTRLMRKYPDIPQWWWYVLLLISIAFSLLLCQKYKEFIQLPWWGFLMACGLAATFTLPVGVITATTNQTPGLNIITEYIMGYILPGKPLANVCFKVFGYMSMAQAIAFLADFKLGHYMKIPPRSMFMVQVIGTLIAGTINMGTAWWLLNSIPNICNQDELPPNSPWTCPGPNVFFDASVIWGLVGPRRIFGNEGVYPALNWFFLGGALAPILVWALHRAFPKVYWIPLINMPILLGASSSLPPASAVNFTSWIVVGIVFNYFVFKYRKNWWKRYNYILSAGLDAGVAFLGVAMYFCLQNQDVSLTWWGNQSDNCPLAQCPTAPGAPLTEGCPVYH